MKTIREDEVRRIDDFLRRVMPQVHQALNEDDQGDALS